MAVKLSAPAAYFVQEGLSSLAFALAYTVQAIYFVQTLHLSPVQLVLIGTVLEAATFVLEVPTGVLADVYGRRLSVVLGFAFLGLGLLVLVLGGTWGWVLGAQAVSALGYTCLSGAQAAWLTDEVGEARVGDLLVRGAQVARVGSLAGLGLAALLGSLNVALPIALGGAVLLGLALLLAFLMPETGFHRQGHGQGTTWREVGRTFVGGVRTVRTRPALLALVGVAVLYGASTEALDRLWEFHLLRSFTWPATPELKPAAWFSLIGAAGTVLGLVVTEGVRRRLDPGDGAHLRRALVWTGGLGTLAVLGFALAGGWGWAVAAFLVFGVVRGLYVPLYTAYLNQGLEPRTRATVLSIASQADALGQVAGGPGVGLVGNVFGIRPALGVSALLRLPVLLVLGWLGRRSRVALPAD